jgi:hypothetical protein
MGFLRNIKLIEKQAVAELCQAQAKLSYPASSPNLTLQPFFQVEMNKVSGGNKLNSSKADCHQ